MKFTADQRKHAKDPSKKWRILGFKRRFYIHQLYGAYWMMKHELHEVGGGWQADSMGMGKVIFTHTAENFVLTMLTVQLRQQPAC